MLVARQVFFSAQTGPHPLRRMCSLTFTEARCREHRRGAGEGGGESHYPFEGGAKEELRAPDGTFEAHFDMLL